MGSKNKNGGFHGAFCCGANKTMEMRIRCILVMGLGGEFQAKNNLFDSLITGDETWGHLNTPEKNRVLMTWKHPSSPVTKKFKLQKSTAKVMATVFWDAKGVILLGILP
ncbi:histone-lysine N-methyltransferase SETMAR [Elysia marginata]|uniref:Histone-lysine N-methyltransferase SETMAR n=1 Tax=Elysia marginata TaxID=1093978 RepID=A0AAV4GW27_9GAST|nr:histone-lysine N-methyltransferase SETMAR [Elysia marginata]